jgi:hypothetical protein
MRIALVDHHGGLPLGSVAVVDVEDGRLIGSDRARVVDLMGFGRLGDEGQERAIGSEGRQASTMSAR